MQLDYVKAKRNQRKLLIFSQEVITQGKRKPFLIGFIVVVLPENKAKRFLFAKLLFGRPITFLRF